MTVFLTPKLKYSWLHTLVITIATLWVIPTQAQTVEINRYQTKGNVVTLRVKVLNEEKIPLQGLEEENFTIKTTEADGNPITISSQKLKVISPTQTTPDPAFIVVLLDMSGSMKHDDASGTKKLKGAINGIQAFIGQMAQENLPVEVSIVPYGEGGKRCPNGYTVTHETIAKNFHNVTDAKLIQQLNELAKVDVCASTKIYENLAAAVTYLGEDPGFKPDPTEPNAPLPKLLVLLLSDGFDVYGNEATRFAQLTTVLRQYPQVTVLTMGYGESLEELRDRSKCALADSQLSAAAVSSDCRLPGVNINEFIVDKPRLTEIAETTGGIHLFPRNETEVGDYLQIFLNTLREYEVKYRQPGADRGTEHEVVVEVNDPDKGLTTTDSAKQKIDMGNFLYDSLPLTERLLLLGGSFGLLIFAGIIPYRKWSKELKEEADRHLEN